MVLIFKVVANVAVPVYVNLIVIVVVVVVAVVFIVLSDKLFFTVKCQLNRLIANICI